jgi:hypothetical protein
MYDRREDREDVGLEERHQQLEAGEGESAVRSENGKITISPTQRKTAAVITAKLVRSRWPASMLAKSRTARESGPHERIWASSMKGDQREDRLGHAGRDRRVLRVADRPLCTTPSTSYRR